jgi:hypothetical protein
MRTAGLIAAFAALLPVAADAADAADPFAAETPMSDADLAEARGGLSVGGFVFDFGVQTMLIVEDATDPAAALQPLTATFDPAVNTIIINNALDGVAISRVVAVDVAVPNFTPALSSAHAGAAGAGLASILLALGSL